ncbi:terminase gpA endonuclease subunit [Teredinibacter purpureus]|uniref:terminase gpA endonuclease subunit n=1 Tax=Teredinibacter purpureus TaxID=2731756 RepID=UPI00069851E0|nr:terminase gpA endonuclease subunit [Teredinibacter purpureus]
MAEDIKPKPPVNTAEWSQKYLQLPEEVGACQREFSLEYGPHLYGIFAAFDDPKIEEIYCMKAAQVLWTTALLAYIFKRICTQAGVFLGMFASESAAKKFALTKMKPVGLATKPVAERMSFSGSTRDGNTTLRKVFDGGFLELFGSNSPGNVKSTTASFVFVEEPDDANEDVGNQGDSIKLLFERTKRSPVPPKKILGGTPSQKGFSRVDEYIRLSDRRVLPIGCHECKQLHVLDFENVHGWEADSESGERHEIFGFNRPDLAVYVCPHCGSPWDDYQRKENIRATVAAAMAAGDPLCGWVATKPTTTVAGFTCLNELYSCLNGVGVHSLVKDYLEAEYYASRGDTSKQVVFINSKLGRPYEYQDGRDNAETLLAHAKEDSESQRAEKVCPSGGLKITVGIDVQDNRLAVLIRAHGRGRRSWLMYADEIYAKVSTTSIDDPVWVELDRIVFAAFEHESGRSLYAGAISIDSGGHATDAVYEWVTTRQKKYPAVKIMAIKGSSSRTNPPVFSPPPAGKVLNFQNPDKLTKADRKNVKLYMVGTNKAKDYLSDQLKLNARGEGRFHFYRANDLRADYFEQLVAEAKVADKTGRLVWKQKPGCPCEFWDCEVYAEHAARAIKIHITTDAEWDKIEVAVTQSDLFNEAVPLVPAKDNAPRYTVKKSTFKRRD